MHLVPVAHLTGIFAPLELLPMLIAAGLYARRTTTLAARGRPVPLWRQICFGAGLLRTAPALITPLSDLAFTNGVELDPARAQRAVAAGHGSTLEAQILGRAERREEDRGVPAR
jgi:hypothetical protein